MIKNQKQAAITKERLAELKNAEASYQLTGDSAADEFAIESLKKLINELEGEIKKYDSLINGNLHCLKPDSLEDISDILIAARLAQKISQKELADRLDLKEQQIQRYESTNYETAAWPRIMEVSMALNLKITFDKIIIMNDTSHHFSFPSGIEAEQIKMIEAKIRNNKSLMFNTAE